MMNRDTLIHLSGTHVLKCFCAWLLRHFDVVLEDEGVAVIATPILRREHVRQAFASLPRDLVGYDDVLGELLSAIAEEVPA